jgi:hypothetical protein
MIRRLLVAADETAQAHDDLEHPHIARLDTILGVNLDSQRAKALDPQRGHLVIAARLDGEYGGFVGADHARNPISRIF